MKKLLVFTKKEFYHIFRDKKTLLILFGMPIIQILLFGFAITNEINNANISIYDKSKDFQSQKLINKILATNYFKLHSYLSSDSEIEETFKTGEVKQVIVIEPNFTENLNKEGSANIHIISDATDPNTGTTLINYTSSIIRIFTNELNNVAMPDFIIDNQMEMRYNKSLKGVYLFVPGLITVILMLVSAMMTSISLTREKENGNMELLLASPMKPIIIIISKVIPYLLIAYIDAILILIMGKFIFGVPIVGSLLLLLLECALFIMMALSLGIFISTKAKTQQVALMVSLVGLMLPTILLSGFIFPIENMPLPLQVVARINPSSWFIIIVKDIMLKGAGLELLWQETLVLIGMTVGFILLSIKNFKIRL